MCLLLSSLIVTVFLSSLGYSWNPGTEFPCPDDPHLFDPCKCSVVSFDSVNYYSQITCTGINGKQIKEAFHHAYHHHPNVSRYYDILEITDVPLLNICCDDLFEGFRFKTIKIRDSKICVIHANAFVSTHGQTSEIVLMDVTFTPNLVDGVQLFRVVRNFIHLKGFYIITSNLEEVPANAFHSHDGTFGGRLEVVRICNSKISHLHDYTFAGLPQLIWIDFGDNQINRVTKNVFSLTPHSHYHQHARTDRPLEISLSGNQLTSETIETGSFDNITRTSVKIYLNDNKLSTLTETTFEPLLRQPNYIIYVDKNPFICDCRHRWLFNHIDDHQFHLKDMKCVEDGASIWTKNLPNVCDRSRLVVESPPGVEVFRKCCRKIKYDRETHQHDHHHHEVHHVHPVPAQQVYYHPPHHDHTHAQQQKEYLIIPQEKSQRPVREYLVQSQFVQAQQKHY